MHLPDSISYSVWLTGSAVTTLALALMLRRRLLREFPFFFAYLAFHVVESLLGLWMYRHFGRASWVYFYEYWITQAVGIGLRFTVIYEIFANVLRPYEGLQRGGRLVFRWVGALLVVLGIWIAIVGPSNEPVFAITGAIVVQRSIDVVQCGLMVLLFLFASYFGLTWRNYVFGIAFGFGLISTVELLASALATESTSFAGAIFNLLPRAIYDLGALVWIIYLFSREPPRMEIHNLPQHDLEKWNQELLELLQR